ncbi:MAG TPA: YggS family pyridoxal phosphate-dependent enzyme [Candidatus Brocadiia bacterium]|nr:YggS family pyridoxal phosphate-dependent enzyme [Candidatus Brocadiia bacterium]
MVCLERIAGNLAEVRRVMAAAAARAGRNVDDIRLVAVTKSVGQEETRFLYDLGLRDFGENRVADAQEKVDAFAGLDVRWHMIGHLQTNKVRKVLGSYALIHSVDSVYLMEEIERVAETRGQVVDILAQVNVSGEETKTGFRPQDTRSALFAASEMPHLRVLGLMTMAPLGSDPEQSRPVFRGLRELRDNLRAEGFLLPELSMGMTQDYPVAIEEGATMVRVGSALFI